MEFGILHHQYPLHVPTTYSASRSVRGPSGPAKEIVRLSTEFNPACSILIYFYIYLPI